jgi:ParB-like chromosome segregation protein Spo0J
VAQVAASIVEFGWTIPILVGADGVIVAGHARLLAARKLGVAEVPVIVLDRLTESQRRAFVLADNKLALNAGWDEEMLRVELESLKEDDFNLAGRRNELGTLVPLSRSHDRGHAQAALWIQLAFRSASSTASG